jgi:hypothetical protein
MNWRKVNRDIRVQNIGKYSEWKEQISTDCHNQCVYCAISEMIWGGLDHYHIDHFRPKSKFKHLEHDVTNLYLACPVCNRFKSDDWKEEPSSLDLICYPDPSDHDYTELFELDKTKYTLEGKYISSKYLLNRLYLNRPQLIHERRESNLNEMLQKLTIEIRSMLNHCENDDLKNRITNKLLDIQSFLLTRSKVRPYKLSEIKKPAEKSA